MGKYSLILVSSFFSFYTIAQEIDPRSTGYYVEALANGITTHTGGSARSVGMAGVQTSLGADLGALSSNPAGLGVYRKSEFVGGLGLNFGSSNSRYLGTQTTDLRPSIGVNSFGVAFCGLKNELNESDWRGGTFAIGMNLLQSYNNSFSFEGKNERNSMINSYIEQANGTSAFVYDKDYTDKNIQSIPSLAYNTYLLSVDTNFSDFKRYKGYIPPDKIMQQSGTVSTSGAMRSWSFGYGSNYKNKLYIGASLGIIALRRTVDKTYSETLLNGGEWYLNNFTFTDKYQLKGTGFNLSLGMIYRLNDVFRFGASLKTPDWFSMKEEYTASISAAYNNVPLSYSDGTPFNLTQESGTLTTQKFNYSYFSPMKIGFGTSIFMNKAGFVSFEGEYVNYSGMLLQKSGANYFAGDNQTIKNIYRDVVNIRAGIELRQDIFRFRGGLAYMPSPFVDGTDSRVKRVVTDANTMFSLGLGLKFPYSFVDFGFNRTNYSSNYSPYTLSNGSQPLTTVSNGSTTFVFTIGSNF
jgi:hypothetical protein